MKIANNIADNIAMEMAYKIEMEMVYKIEMELVYNLANKCFFVMHILCIIEMIIKHFSCNINKICYNNSTMSIKFIVLFFCRIFHGGVCYLVS